MSRVTFLYLMHTWECEDKTRKEQCRKKKEKKKKNDNNDDARCKKRQTLIYITQSLLCRKKE